MQVTVDEKNPTAEIHDGEGATRIVSYDPALPVRLGTGSLCNPEDVEVLNGLDYDTVLRGITWGAEGIAIDAEAYAKHLELMVGEIKEIEHREGELAPLTTLLTDLIGALDYLCKQAGVVFRMADDSLDMLRFIEGKYQR